ncbi:MAG: hypothetical protein AAF715_22005 [Myxococcota bacterium]
MKYGMFSGLALGCLSLGLLVACGDDDADDTTSTTSTTTSSSTTSSMGGSSGDGGAGVGAGSPAGTGGGAAQGGSDGSGGNDGPTIWNGATTTFTKAPGSDATMPANQDQLTPGVIITRSTVGGPIYNAAVDQEPTEMEVKNGTWSAIDGPSGTEWAQGSLSDALNLTYTSLRQATGGGQGAYKDLVGEGEFVLHLIDEDIYLSVTFTSWSQGGAPSNRGGFAYTRSTPP